MAKDLMLEISRSRGAQTVLRALGLKLPLPTPLRRQTGPMVAKPLDGLTVAYAGAGDGRWQQTVTEVVEGAGGAVTGWSTADRAPLDAVVIDATTLASVADLDWLGVVGAAAASRLRKNGRMVVLGVSPDGLKTSAAAVQQALEGFSRSAAKELGRRGATANLVQVATDVDSALVAPLLFLLSARSAFVSAQVLALSAVEVAANDATQALRGQVALVTGAARGIGEATARALADEGAKVMLVDRPAEEAALASLAAEIGGIAVGADLSDAEGITAIVDAVAAAGGVDIVVHNAGITRDRMLARMTPERWKPVLDVNLAAVLRLHEALLATGLRDGGRVVCLSSVAGIAGNVGQTAYGASKAGVIGFVRAEGARLASRGITVNAVAPGFIETRMTAAIPMAIREAARRLSALGQGGQPEDVAAAITFFAQPGTAAMSGRVLRVCGGALIGA